mgnify:CR=1 FL=1
MALETLRDLKEIGGFEIGRCDENTDRPDNYIHIVDSANAIAFKIQNGPIKEAGVNGCQVDTIIETAKLIMLGLDKQFPCHENSQCAYHLTQALEWLKQRRINREQRGVEGLSKE